MSNLIYDLLLYSHIGREHTTELVDCNVLLNEVLDDLKGTIDKAKPIIKVGILPSISGNKMALHQLFLNLISNAIKFRKTDEKLSISITVKVQGSDYEFCIEDNGVGMDPDYTDRIFGIFQRLRNRREVEGTGIGLASCKKIVEMHNGEFKVDSKLGVGTKFYFTLQDL